MRRSCWCRFGWRHIDPRRRVDPRHSCTHRPRTMRRWGKCRCTHRSAWRLSEGRRRGRRSRSRSRSRIRTHQRRTCSPHRNVDRMHRNCCCCSPRSSSCHRRASIRVGKSTHHSRILGRWHIGFRMCRNARGSLREQARHHTCGSHRRVHCSRRRVGCRRLRRVVRRIRRHAHSVHLARCIPSLMGNQNHRCKRRCKQNASCRGCEGRGQRCSLPSCGRAHRSCAACPHPLLREEPLGHIRQG